MKLISEYYDLARAEGISERLRRAGVMTVVTSKRSYSLSRIRTGAFKVGLWAVFDDQAHDAVQLIHNRNHKPERIISLSEMEELEETVKEQFSAKWKKLTEKTAAWIFGVLLLALLLYVAVGIINDA